MKLKLILLTILLTIVSPLLVMASSGGTDRFGGHTESSTGNYHSHTGGSSTSAHTSGGGRGVVRNYVDPTFPWLRVPVRWVPPCVCVTSDVDCYHKKPLKLKTMEESEKVVYNDSRLEWYIKMATNGNRYAIYELANCYFKGIGTKKDVASGLKWISLLQKEPYQDSVVLYNNYQAEKGNVYVSR
jgi:hypothetical protein